MTGLILIALSVQGKAMVPAIEVGSLLAGT